MPLESVVYVLIRSLRVRRVESEIVPTRFCNGGRGAEGGSRFEVPLRVHIAGIRTILRALIGDAETIERDELIIGVSRLRSRMRGEATCVGLPAYRETRNVNAGRSDRMCKNRRGSRSYKGISGKKAASMSAAPVAPRNRLEMDVVGQARSKWDGAGTE